MSLAAEQQDTAQKILKAFEIFKASGGVIRPHMILTGPSGSGKSHIIKALSTKLNLKCIEINAAQITKEGMSGNSLSKALVPLKAHGDKPVILFCDEFDKLFINGNTNNPMYNESTIGVQNEFLHLLESNLASVMGSYGHYDNVSIGKALFVFTGAFNGQTNINVDDLRSFGIKTEFIGRVGIIYNLSALSLESMLLILQNSELLNNYLKLFPSVTKEKVIEDLTPYIKERHDNNTLGTRMLSTLIHQYFINDGKITSDEIVTTTFSTHFSFEV